MSQAADCISQDRSRAYTSLRLFASGPVSGHAREADCKMNAARFELDADLAPLFPYINALADHAQFYAKPVYIKFMFGKRLCGFYPDRGAFTPVRDMADALDFLPRLLDFLTDIARRAPDLIPNHKTYKPASAVTIYRLLPGTNCRTCGYDTCMAFAAALSRCYTDLSLCPHVTPPVEETATFPVHDKQGNLVRTVSVTIDTVGMRLEMKRQDTRIRELQSRLAAFELAQHADFEAANDRLPVPLSRREVQVLRQIVGGATNRQISTALRISTHTVKSHVTSIFNKLGVNDRAQAAAWGAVHGVGDC